MATAERLGTALRIAILLDSAVALPRDDAHLATRLVPRACACIPDRRAKAPQTTGTMFASTPVPRPEFPGNNHRWTGWLKCNQPVIGSSAREGVAGGPD